jgi:aryl-alcohol dehydrogenase-like predicted oxidoreductase
MGNATSELRELGKSGVMVPAMGVGTMLWRPGGALTAAAIREAYTACVDNGLNFFDSAEIYGTEPLLGDCIKKDKRPVMVATKFAPPSKMIPGSRKRANYPADSPKALLDALDGSLSRLGVDCIDLYQMHAPPSKNTITDYMDVMAEAVKAGKIRTVGVCNFSEAQIREAHKALANRGIALATAMVGYNLLRRWPETNGVFAACKELGVSVIPYAPLAEGVLTGKYRDGKKKVPIGYSVALYFGHLDITKERNDGVPFVRRLFSKPRELNRKKMESLFFAMEKVAKDSGKTLAQVAINWLITNDDVHILPIPGMKTAKQVNDNVGARDWRLTDNQRALINKAEVESRV